MIYKSSAAYSFPKAGKVPESNLISKSKKNNPPPGYHTGDIITKAKKGFIFSKEEKLKHKLDKHQHAQNMMELKRDYSVVVHLITVSHLKMEPSLQLGTEIYYITNDM